MFVTNAVDRRTFAFARKPKLKSGVVNNLMGLNLGDPLADEALTTMQLRNALQIVNGIKPLPAGVSMDSYRALAVRAKKAGITTSTLQGLSDGPNPFDTTGVDTSTSNPTTAADYLKSFTDFANQAATSAAQIQASARQVAAAYRAPLAPVSVPQRAVNAVSNFSRSNTPVMLAIAGVLAAVLVVPRLMRR
jgi:hypothetical protein